MKNVVIGGLLIVFSTITHAECIGPVVNGKCLTGVDSGGYNSGGYQGSSGSSYQYDMNNGSDRNSYGLDLGAQRRDQMYNGVGRGMDQGLGQYGGGIYDY